MPLDPRIPELEELAFAAWPAAEVVEIAGWRCRHTPPRVTRRGNSVWPGELRESWSLEQRLARVEHFYAARGMRPLFHVSPLAQPAELDAALADRGWSHEAAVSIQIAESSAVARAVAGSRAETAARPGPDWLEVGLRRSRFADSPEAFLGILERIGPRAGFAMARAAGVPAATGLGVRQGDWVGLFAMLTLPEWRRRGHGRAVLGALARWAEHAGASRLYLQVERDNPAALELYRAAGFRELYGYHYRRAPAGDVG